MTPDTCLSLLRPLLSSPLLLHPDQLFQRQETGVFRGARSTQLEGTNESFPAALAAYDPTPGGVRNHSRFRGPLVGSETKNDA